MAKYKNDALYRKISDAREATGGCDMHNPIGYITLIQRALNHATSYSAPDTIIIKLRDALRTAEFTNVFENRLKADEILCDIMNNDVE
jgi:hypothetical protein